MYAYFVDLGDECPSGDNSRWLMTDHSCFYISSLLDASKHLTWSDANTYCNNLDQNHGTKLMSILSADDMVMFCLNNVLK